MEVLSTNLIAAQNDKSIHGLKFARSTPSLSHLFFDDDALFSSKVSQSMLEGQGNYHKLLQ